MDGGRREELKSSLSLVDDIFVVLLITFVQLVVLE